MSSRKHDSTVIQLLDLVWANCNKVQGHSWERLNTSMHSALTLAITSGMVFDLGDFASFERRYRFGYWGIQHSGSNGFAEGFYVTAVACGNMSAAKSFEQWKGRKPFIVEDAEAERHAVGRGCESNCGGRLAIGSRFRYRGEYVTVTSFSGDGEHLTACTYKPVESGSGSRKIAKRFKITREDLLQYRRRLKLLGMLTEYANKGDAEHKEVRKLLKMRKNTKPEDVSFEALEAAVKTLGLKAKKTPKAEEEGDQS